LIRIPLFFPNFAQTSPFLAFTTNLHPQRAPHSLASHHHMTHTPLLFFPARVPEAPVVVFALGQKKQKGVKSLLDSYQ
jgi:hypothetical protein